MVWGSIRVVRHFSEIFFVRVLEVFVLVVVVVVVVAVVSVVTSVTVEQRVFVLVGLVKVGRGGMGAV